MFDFAYPEPKPKDHDGDNKQYQNFNQINAPSSAQPDGNIHYTERKPYNGDYAGQPVNILSKTVRHSRSLRAVAYHDRPNELTGQGGTARSSNGGKADIEGFCRIEEFLTKFAMNGTVALQNGIAEEPQSLCFRIVKAQTTIQHL